MVIGHHRGPGFPTLLNLPELDERERERRLGRCSVECARPLHVGEFTTVSFTFEVGDSGVATEGHLGICWRWPYDWHDLQSHDAAGDGYLGVELDACTSGVRVAPRYDRMGGVEPWHHVVIVRVEAGSLAPGDRVRIVCGDRRGGGRGWRAPSCASSAAGFVLMVDPDGTRVDGGIRWLRLADPPTVPLVAGPASRLVAIAPSQAVAEAPFELLLRAEDRWGNPTRLPLGSAGAEGERVRVAAFDLGSSGLASESTSGDVRPGQAQPVPLEASASIAEDGTSLSLAVTLARKGTYSLRVQVRDPSRDDGGFVAQSNPVLVTEGMPMERLFWGDLHAGQSAIGCGRGSVAEHYTYARASAALQFASEQSNDHYVTEEDWNQLRRAAEEFDDPGTFVTFLGCEWSPETPEGGDRNVFYRRDESRLRRSGRYFLETDPDPEPDIPTAAEFHRAFREEDVLVNIHVGGRMTNVAWHDGRIERLAEIHSTHGTIEWFIADVIERGYRVGITAGTDGVMGRPGADQPGHGLIRNVPNGLTAVYAPELTRSALWQAFQQRRCYATSGERIVLAMDVDGHAMGSEYETGGHPTVTLQVTGTAPLAEVDVLRGTVPIHRWRASHAPAPAPGERCIQVLWSGTGARGSAQAQRLSWNGTLRIDGGAFLETHPLGYFAPDGGLRLEDATTISWLSTTAGNEVGAIIRCHGGADARLRFSSAPCEFTFRLGEVETEPFVVEAGPVDRRVTIAPAPSAAAPRSLTLTYTDSDAPLGDLAYWVRVVQRDRAKAWSSPVYVSRREDE
ncbi:MAG: DUF3604 domain-containing protein [Trueperaceae bacterium]|nr:DUF3604 domain-containing protein [Trueperaceae bacterium]